MGKNSFLKRYTQLFTAIEYLETGELQLHSPEKWEDTNDSLALQMHAKKEGAAGIFTLCLTEASETFHHWKVFCPKPGEGDGACIEFDKDELKKAADHAGLTRDEVGYLSIEDLAAGSTKGKATPFLKRLPYRHEREYRLFGTSSSLSEGQTLSFEVPRKAIKRITLSPWMSPETAKEWRKFINQLDGCKDLPVVRSTLLDNKDWKKAIEQMK